MEEVYHIIITMGQAVVRIHLVNSLVQVCRNIGQFLSKGHTCSK